MKKPFPVFLFFFLAFFQLPFSVCAQTDESADKPVRLTFLVYETMTKQPLEGAVCTVMEGGQELIRVETDSLGILFMELGSDKEVIMEFSHPGYRTKSLDLVLASLAGLELDLEMQLTPDNWTRFKGTLLNRDNNIYPEDIDVTIKNLNSNEEHIVTSDFGGNFYFYVEDGMKYSISINDIRFKPKTATLNTDCRTDRYAAQYCLTGFSFQDLKGTTEEGLDQLEGQISLSIR